MPKETIRMNDDFNNFNVQVGWTKDREMQVGIDHSEGRSLFWVLLERNVEWIGLEARRIVAEADDPETLSLGDIRLGKNILNMLDCSTSGPVSSVWTTPSRHEVNELIRVLRRARDSAYGKDE